MMSANRFLAAVFLLAGTFWTASPATAQVPQLINYQGRLTDSTCATINATIPLTFRIYSVPVAGAPLWTEAQSVTCADGIFSVMLGSTTPFPANLFQSSPLYLGVESGVAGELTPRAQFASVPYALYTEFALRAETATYAESTGFATRAATADSAALATNALFASRADSATYADTAGYAIKAETAGYAGVAGYADSAAMAAIAIIAETATYAETAGYAIRATTADTALFAGLADSANSAVRADSATRAVFAETAMFALNSSSGSAGLPVINLDVPLIPFHTVITASTPSNPVTQPWNVINIASLPGTPIPASARQIYLYLYIRTMVKNGIDDSYNLRIRQPGFPATERFVVSTTNSFSPDVASFWLPVDATQRLEWASSDITTTGFTAEVSIQAIGWR